MNFVAFLWLQINDVARAPDVRGYRAGRGGGQEDRVIVLDRAPTNILEPRPFPLRRRHQSQSPQAPVKLVRP